MGKVVILQATGSLIKIGIDQLSHTDTNTDVDSVARLESFRALKSSEFESFRALKLSGFESFRA